MWRVGSRDVSVAGTLHGVCETACSFCTSIMMMIDECAFCMARGNWEEYLDGMGRLGVWKRRGEYPPSVLECCFSHGCSCFLPVYVCTRDRRCERIRGRPHVAWQARQEYS